MSFRPEPFGCAQGRLRPIPYGIHGGIAKFYKATPEVERPATLDHLVAAVAG